MNYKESQEILDEIKKASKILVNFHKSPDGDSVGSGLAMYSLLKNLGKEVKIVTVDDLPEEYKFLPNSDTVDKTDYSVLNFSEYDLFIALDSSVWAQVVRDTEIKQPDIPFIVIDHHFTNPKFGTINVVDADKSSTAEVLFGLISDWNVTIDKDVATCLLTGLIYDTSSLQNPAADMETAEIFSKLMSYGADKDEIIFNIYRSLDLEKVNALSEILHDLKIDTEYKFVWSALAYENYKEYKDITGVKTIAANLFSASIKDTDFGIIMVEESEKVLNVSFRGRTDVDTSKIAESLGGGGHKKASAARVEGLVFEEAVNKVLDACRKYAKKSS